MRAQIEKKLAQKEKEKREENLRQLAQKAREERAGIRRVEGNAICWTVDDVESIWQCRKSLRIAEHFLF